MRQTSGVALWYLRMEKEAVRPVTADNPTVLRLRLGAELRELRHRREWSLEDVVGELRAIEVDIFSISKLNRLENGKGAVKIQDVRALIDLYQVDNEAQRETLLRMAREARAAAPAAWWTDYESVLPSGLSTYVGLEAAAGKLMCFTHTLIDGLLQTEDYARATIRAARYNDSQQAIDRLVELRMQRQKMLRASPRLDLVTIMDEGALLRQIGGREAMRAQLRHIVEVCEQLTNVSVLVVPLTQGAYPVMHGMFTLIEPREASPGVAPMAYVDSPVGNLYLQRPEQIETFRELFGRLRAVAVDPEESLRIVRAAAEEK
jgi:transcriptional regulator with XRE-family HTH domain